jgi:hypothetical protein
MKKYIKTIIIGIVLGLAFSALNIFVFSLESTINPKEAGFNTAWIYKLPTTLNYGDEISVLEKERSRRVVVGLPGDTITIKNHNIQTKNGTFKTSLEDQTITLKPKEIFSVGRKESGITTPDMIEGKIVYKS